MYLDEKLEEIVLNESIEKEVNFLYFIQIIKM
jgi:hypothetical protein